MRRAALEHRVRVLEGRIATLDASITGDFELADARTEAALAQEQSQRVLKGVRWLGITMTGASLVLAALTIFRT